MMEFPWPKWMEFVVLGISVVLGVTALNIIDRIQQRRWSQNIGPSETQNEQGVPLAIETGLRQTT